MNNPSTGKYKLRRRRAKFSAFVQGPTGGPAVTNASLTLPDGMTKPITNAFGSFSLFGSPETEALLESTYPPGDYVFRFQQNGLPERSATINMPATPTSTPQISNLAEAQTIDPAASFTLRWNAYSPVPAGATILLTIADEIGNLVYLAPNPCIPRSLVPSDTSATIPANYFKPGFNYRGTLTFGLNFFNDTNSIPGMFGFGNILRSTTFPLKTTGGGGGGTLPEPPAARFTAFRRLASGRPELTPTGTPSRTYTIQRVGNLAATIWPSAGTVTVNASGTAIFEDATANLQFPAFYRAVGN